MGLTISKVLLSYKNQISQKILALYGFAWSLGNQYNVGTLSWFSLAFTPNVGLYDNHWHAHLQPLSHSKKAAGFRDWCQKAYALNVLVQYNFQTTTTVLAAGTNT